MFRKTKNSYGKPPMACVSATNTLQTGIQTILFYSSEQTLLTGLEAVSILDSIILGIPLWL